MPEAGAVRVEVFDLGGRRVAVAFAGAFDAGVHSVEWSGRTESGEPATAGRVESRCVVRLGR